MIKEFKSYQQGQPILIDASFARNNLARLESYLRKGDAELLTLAKQKPKFDANEQLPEGLLIQRADFEASVMKVSTGYMIYRPDEVAKMGDVVLDVGLEDVVGKFDTCESYGTQTLAKAIRTAAELKNVSMILLRVDSPGGSVSGTQTLTTAIRYARNKGKLVIGYVDDGYAASAAYWIISECDHVYASSNTDYIGSIGIMITLANWNKFYEGEGLQIIELYSQGSDLKNADVREALEGNTERLMAKLNSIRNEFVTAVKTNRGDKLSFEPGSEYDVFRGDTYNAKTAKKIGLIDDIKSIEWVTENGLKMAKKKANGSIKLESETLHTEEMKKITLRVGTHDSIIALLGLKAEGDQKEFEMEGQDLLFNLSARLSDEQAKAAKTIDTINASVQQVTTAVAAAEERIVALGKTEETITGLTKRIEALEEGTEKPIQAIEDPKGGSKTTKPGYDENGKYVGVIRHPDYKQ